MTTRLTLLCAGATRGARAARFPDAAEPLDDGGRAKVRALARGWRDGARAYVSPAAAARETAALLGVVGEESAALRDHDYGDWAGCGLDEVDPAALAAWMAAPEHGVPGGEDLAAVRARVGAWLDTLGKGHALAITHPAVIRAALAHALDLPVAATLAIDVAPLTRVVLSRHGRWRLQALVPA